MAIGAHIFLRRSFFGPFFALATRTTYNALRLSHWAMPDACLTTRRHLRTAPSPIPLRFLNVCVFKNITHTPHATQKKTERAARLQPMLGRRGALLSMRHCRKKQTESNTLPALLVNATKKSRRTSSNNYSNNKQIRIRKKKAGGRCIQGNLLTHQSAPDHARHHN